MKGEAEFNMQSVKSTSYHRHPASLTCPVLLQTDVSRQLDQNELCTYSQISGLKISRIVAPRSTTGANRAIKHRRSLGLTRSKRVSHKLPQRIPNHEEVEAYYLSSEKWWAMRDSNSRHPRCKRGALPTELIALSRCRTSVRRVGGRDLCVTGENRKSV